MIQYSTQDLINAGIPLDINISELYQELAFGTRLNTLPGKTFLRTLKKRYPQIDTLKDLFDHPSQSKPFQTLREGILSSSITILDIHSDFAELSLPQNASFKTMEEGLRLFKDEYLYYKDKRMKSHRAAADKYIKTLSIFLDENSSDRSVDKICSLLKVKSQRIYQILSKIGSDFNAMFLKETVIDGLSVDPVLARSVKDLNDSFNLPGRIENLKALSGITSPIILDLLCLILDYKILESGVVTKGDFSGRTLDLNVGRVKRVLVDEGIPITFDDLMYLLGEKIEDDTLRQELVKYSKTHPEFEIINKNGTDLIAVRWEYLNNNSAEMIRILYDNDAWDLISAMSKAELQLEWDRRARLAGFTKPFRSSKSKQNWRLCPTHGGFWRLRKDRKDKHIPGQEYVASLIRSNPTWTVDDVLKQAGVDGYLRIHPIGTIRSYYTNIVKDPTVEQAMLAAKRILSAEPRKTMSLSSLHQSVNKSGVNIQYEQFRKWIMRNSAAFQYSSQPGKRQVDVTLLNRKAPIVATKSQYLATKTTSKASKSPSRTIVAAPQIDWEAIRAFINLQVPEISCYPSLSGAIDKMFFIIKNGKNDLAPNSVFLGWLKEITSSNTLPSWEKNRVRKEVLGSIEAYIKCFYSLKTKRDISNDIESDPSFATKSIGLGTFFAFLSKQMLFPDPYLHYQKGSLELKLILAKKTIWEARNEVSHPLPTVNLADHLMSAQIHDSLFVFLFLAAQL